MAIKYGAADFQTLLPAKVLFPFAVLGARWVEFFWDIPLLLLFFQFPIYAVILTIAAFRSRTRSTALAVTVMHTIAVVACFAIDGTRHS